MNNKDNTFKKLNVNINKKIIIISLCCCFVLFLTVGIFFTLHTNNDSNLSNASSEVSDNNSSGNVNEINNNNSNLPSIQSSDENDPFYLSDADFNYVYGINSQIEGVTSSNSNIVSDLNKKICIVLSGGDTSGDYYDYCQYRTVPLSFNSNFNYDVFYDKLNNHDRLYYLLVSMSKKFYAIDIKQDNVNISSDVADYFLGTGYVAIDGNLVREESKRLYGYEVPFTNVSFPCMIYAYDSSNDRFYHSTGCGYSSTISNVELYKNKYVFDGDYAYVYTNVGISRPMSEEKFDIYNDIVSQYDDIDSGNVLAYKTVDKFKDSFITIDNHTEFKEYIFVFKKDSNGNYYFVNVKKS